MPHIPGGVPYPTWVRGDILWQEDATPLTMALSKGSKILAITAAGAGLPHFRRHRRWLPTVYNGPRPVTWIGNGKVLATRGAHRGDAGDRAQGGAGGPTGGG
jgi:hypothetical protein